MDPFAALGLPSTATAAEVKAAYREAAQRLHPDKGGDGKEFAALCRAYKEAMQEAELPVPCIDCRGTGRREVVGGWSSTTVVCLVCSGSGQVPRGQE